MPPKLLLCRYKCKQTKKMKDLLQHAHELRDVLICASTKPVPSGICAGPCTREVVPGLCALRESVGIGSELVAIGA